MPEPDSCVSLQTDPMIMEGGEGEEGEGRREKGGGGRREEEEGGEGRRRGMRRGRRER